MTRSCEKCGQKKSGEIYLFRFPKHEEHKKKWVEFVGKDYFVPKGHSALCSLHKLLQKLSICGLTYISSRRPNLLVELDNCHHAKLFKGVFAMFFSLKVKHMCKLKNDEFKTFVRRVCKKIPIYKHQ